MGRGRSLLGRQNLYFSAVRDQMGRHIVLNSVLWVANYQMLRTNGVSQGFRYKSQLGLRSKVFLYNSLPIQLEKFTNVNYFIFNLLLQ